VEAYRSVKDERKLTINLPPLDSCSLAWKERRRRKIARRWVVAGLCTLCGTYCLGTFVRYARWGVQMNIRICLLAIVTFSCGIVRADVQSETACYVYVPRDSSSKPIKLALRTYVDKDLKKEVGAFVQYNASKETIPLVFTKYVSTDTDSPNLGNYEISRVEIVDKKIAGEYVFIQSGAGNTQGKYVVYTKSKTGKKITFMYTGDNHADCKIVN